MGLCRSFLLKAITELTLNVDVATPFLLTEFISFVLFRAKTFLLPSFCFALHTILALNALGDLSIPM